MTAQLFCCFPLLLWPQKVGRREKKPEASAKNLDSKKEKGKQKMCAFLCAHVVFFLRSPLCCIVVRWTRRIWSVYFKRTHIHTYIKQQKFSPHPTTVFFVAFFNRKGRESVARSFLLFFSFSSLALFSFSDLFSTFWQIYWICQIYSSSTLNFLTHLSFSSFLPKRKSEGGRNF